MAIAKPVTKTLISTIAWGIPITDEVNRLTDWQTLNAKVPWGRVAHVAVTTAQNGITTLVDLTGLTVTFTAVANRYYKVTLGGFTAYTNSNGGTCDLVIRDSNNQYLGKSNGNVSAGGAWIPSAICITRPLTFPPGLNTVKGSAAFSGAGGMNTAADATAQLFLIVEDIGPTT